MSINTSNIPLSELQRIYNTQQTILGDMKDNDILLPGMSAEDFKKINEAIGKLDLEGGQPDPVGDDADKNSPNASINAGLQDMSLNPNMSPEEAAEKHGTTVAALANLNSEYAQREPKLGAFVSFIGNTFGPKIGPMVENLRETPRQSYSRMTSRFGISKAGLPPSEYGLSLPSFSPTSKTEPVSFVPYSPEDQALHEAQQAAAAQEEAEVGIGPVGAGGYDSKNQATIDAALDQSRMEGYDKMTGGDFDAPASYGMFDDPSYDAPDTGNENEGDQTGGAGEYGGPSGAGGMGGYLNTGGRVGALIQHLRTGGDVENAETNMGNANIPMGIVNDPDGAPSPFSGGTGVEDDLDMDVEAGSYVLNAESVQLIGISDINAVIRDAYSIAAALGQPMPQDYDPQNKVPIRISNGEAVIPKPLVDIIGLDKLEKWNKKGLELRKQKEKMMAEQQQAQPPQQQQVAAEAPMQQQMGQLMNKGGQAYYNVLSGKEETLEEMAERGDSLEKIYKTVKDNPLELLGYAGREVAGLAGFTIDDKHRARKIWSRYHGKDPTIKQEISFAIHQNLYGKAPKEKELQNISTKVVQDYAGDYGISGDMLKDVLYRTALHESLGGKYKRQQVKGKSVGVARGWWQVEPSTAISMLTEGKDKGFIGPKVEARLIATTGKTLDELKNLITTSKGQKQFKNLLENNQEFNATMASLNILVKLKDSNDLDLLRE